MNQRTTDVLVIKSQVVLGTRSPDVLVTRGQVVLRMTSQDALMISQDVPVMKDLVGLGTNHQMTDLRGGRQRVLQDALVDLVMILRTKIVRKVPIATQELRQEQSHHDIPLSIRMNRKTTSPGVLETKVQDVQMTNQDVREMMSPGVLGIVPKMMNQEDLEMTSLVVQETIRPKVPTAILLEQQRLR